MKNRKKKKKKKKKKKMEEEEEEEEEKEEGGEASLEGRTTARNIKSSVSHVLSALYSQAVFTTYVLQFSLFPSQYHLQLHYNRILHYCFDSWQKQCQQQLQG